MPDRSLVVRLVADSTSLQRELKKAQQQLAKYKQAAERGGGTDQLRSQTAAVKEVTAAEEALVKVRGRRGSSIGPFRIAGAGVAAAAAVTATAQATRALADALETTGQAAFTTEGRLKNMFAALASFDVVGAVAAWTQMPKTLEEAGLVGKGGGLITSPARMRAMEEVSQGIKEFVKGKDLKTAAEEWNRLTAIAGTDQPKIAQLYLDTAAAMERLAGVTSAMDFAQRQYNTTLVDGIATQVEFKGAVDDRIRATRGEALGGVPPSLQTTPGGPRYRASPAERARRRNVWFDARVARQLDILQDKNLRGQLAGLKTVEAQLRARLEATKDATRRLTLEEQIRAVNRDQLSIQEQMTEQAKAANQALKDRAEAIKSAVIERLQRKQTNILNQRALQDALEQLRLAKRIGGPRGILEARRGVTDVRYEMMLARLQAQPATLTKGGMFSLGNQITININGATDPDKIARQVVSIIQRRTKHTNDQARGPTAGSATGNK